MSKKSTWKISYKATFFETQILEQTSMIYAYVNTTEKLNALEGVFKTVKQARAWAEGMLTPGVKRCRIWRINRRRKLIFLVGHMVFESGKWQKKPIDDPIGYCLPEIVERALKENLSVIAG